MIYTVNFKCTTTHLRLHLAIQKMYVFLNNHDKPKKLAKCKLFSKKIYTNMYFKELEKCNN